MNTKFKLIILHIGIVSTIHAQEIAVIPKQEYIGGVCFILPTAGFSPERDGRLTTNTCPPFGGKSICLIAGIKNDSKNSVWIFKLKKN